MGARSAYMALVTRVSRVYTANGPGSTKEECVKVGSLPQNCLKHYVFIKRKLIKYLFLL